MGVILLLLSIVGVVLCLYSTGTFLYGLNEVRHQFGRKKYLIGSVNTILVAIWTFPIFGLGLLLITLSSTTALKNL